MSTDFTTVTELSGDEVTAEQVERLRHRYLWAGPFCQGRAVLEVACGAGQGLAYLSRQAGSLMAGDITPALVERARRHYGDRIDIRVLDAANLPLPDRSLDVVILFEAIYYLPDAHRFVAECRRVLRSGGQVLVATANKDLYDFNPSPFSHRYYGVVELGQLFGKQGFRCEFFGAHPYGQVTLRQRLLRPIKRLAVALHLMPKTMAGKKLLKRLVFGGLVIMPDEIGEAGSPYVPPVELPAGRPDREHKVLYLAASLV
ncbi:MAG TPA: class I SAM-dependent methyltransferase [Thiobacillaceae bacterium]|nr:class I SAM-dependent methyltransferase [Thiobacillaceae bacterium]